MVLAAACLRDGALAPRLGRVTGIEVLPLLHAYAEEKHGALCAARALAPAPCAFVLGDFASEPAALAAIASADAVFAFATTWDSCDGVLTTLSFTLARHLAVGAFAITVDKLLPELPAAGRRFRLLERFDGPNEATGESTVYVYRLEACA